MTTTTINATTEAVANGLAPIPFNFQAISNAEIGVLKAGVEVFDFTVNLNGDDTGTVTPLTNWGNASVLIFSKPTFGQPSNFIRFGAFYPDQFVAPLDRLMRSLNAVREGVGFERPFGASERMGRYMAWDAEGNLYPSSGTGNDAALRTDLAAAGGAALIGLGNGSSLANALRVNLASYGFRANRTAAQNLAALQTAIAANAGAPHPVVIDVPPDTYSMDAIGIVTPNIWIDWHGSTLLGTVGQVPISSGPAATGFRMKNLRIVGDTATSLLTLDSSGGGLQNVDLVKTGLGDGYMMMTEGTTDNVFDSIRLSGGNGIFIEGQRLLFCNIHGVARAAGGDDFLKFAARNQRTGDIAIVGVVGKGFASGLAFGGEIGTLGAASAGRVGRVENVIARGIDLTECVYGLYTKPGAVDGGVAYDWRDGLVRGIDVELRIGDATGAKMARAVVLSAARNALVEWPKITITGSGRFANTADDESWAQIYLPDSTGWVSGGAGGTVREVELNVIGNDIYDGADNAGPTPGYPPLYGVAVTKAAAGVGTIDRVRINARINGTKGAGIVVSPGNDNAVTIERLIGRNLAVNPPATTGGIHAESIVRAPGANEISMANNASKPIYITGTGDVIGKRFTFDITSAAGVDATLLRQVPHDVWLRKVTAQGKDAVGASGAVYFSIELRAVNGLTYDGSALNGNPLTTFNTTATAVVAFTPFNFPAMPADIGAGASFVDRFLRSGAVIRIAKTNTGGGQPFTGSVDVHYVQIGRRD